MEKTETGSQMSLLEHLGELRKRLIHSIGGIIVGFAIAYFFSEEIFRVLTVPFDEAYRAAFSKEPRMITTGLVESFLVYLKVGLIGGIFISCPYIFLQLWKFVAPGLYAQEKKYVWPFVVLATLFFLGGALFGYFIVFPLGFQYFLQMVPTGYVDPMIRMQEYFSLASWMLLVFGAVFELPLIVLTLAFFGLVTPKQLIRPWRGVVVGIIVGAAIITPADPLSMVLLAVPMAGLYGITILVSFVVARKPKKS